MLQAPRAYKICWVLASLVLLGVAQPAFPADRYTVVDLGVLEQAVSGVVRGLNTSDEVVGGSIGFGRGKRAFLVTGGSAENLEGLPGTDSSSAHAINDQTTVIGSSNTTSSIRAFIWTRNGVQDLGTLPGDSAQRGIRHQST